MLHSDVPADRDVDRADAGQLAEPDGLAGADQPADAIFGWTWLGGRRAQRVVYAALLLEVAVVIVFAAVYRPFDLNIYLWGGRAVLHGLRLYSVQVKANWYTYPPFAAIVLTPLVAIPVVIVDLAWELGSVAAFAWACVICLRLAGYRPSRVAVAATVALGLLLEPMYHTLFLGQVNIFLMTLVLADIWRASRGRAAGIGVGLATAIKLTPGIFILFFLVTRRFKDAAIAAGSFGCTVLLGFLVDPSASRLYWTRLFYDTKRVSAVYISNQTPYAALTRILGGVSHVGSWYLVISLLLGAVGLAVAATLVRREDWLGAAAVTGMTGLLVSPISWTHHWVWIMPALVVLLRGGGRSQIAAAAAYVLFVLAPMWFTPWHGVAGDYGFHWLVTLVANSFLIAGLTFLGYMTVRAYRAPQAADELAQASDLR